MRLLTHLVVAAVAALGAACGNSIGDSCSQASDCSQEEARICLGDPGGYCTIQGCDVGTCPDEAVCVRFFPVSSLTVECTTAAECALDEVCTSPDGMQKGKCAPRSLETRFCMAKCSSHGDCRDNYECRNPERMALHGGIPVVDEGAAVPSFCAVAKDCGFATEGTCDLGDTCDTSSSPFYCRPSP